MALRAVEDDDGNVIEAGDWVHFGYGTPGVGVRAEVVERDGMLIVLTPGHKPSQCRLDKLRGYVGNFWKIKAPTERK